MGGQLSKGFILFLSGLSLFFIFQSNSVQATADLPINSYFTECSVNPQSTPDDCRDAPPYGPYVDVGWNRIDDVTCGGSACTYTVLRNDQPAITNLLCNESSCT